MMITTRTVIRSTNKGEEGDDMSRELRTALLREMIALIESIVMLLSKRERCSVDFCVRRDWVIGLDRFASLRLSVITTLVSLFFEYNMSQVCIVLVGFQMWRGVLWVWICSEGVGLTQGEKTRSKWCLGSRTRESGR
jgi:hypothetical protein